MNFRRNKSGLLAPDAPTARGFTGPGGGYDSVISVPVRRRATTAIAKGLYPWVAGAEAPNQGVLSGRTISQDGSPGVNVHCDPITWFEVTKLILNPSAFVLGLPGFGKSTLIRRWIMVLSYWGVLPFVLGDVKGEYVDIIEGIGGQVISPGRGRDRVNPLDLGGALEAAQRIGGPAGAKLLADAKARRQIAVEGLMTVQRGHAPTDHETLLIDLAMGLLDDTFAHVTHRQPLLSDLNQVFGEAPTELCEAALWRDNMDRYYEATDEIRKSLNALTQGSGLGWVFSAETTNPIRPNVPVCFNLSGVSKDDRKLRAALQLTSWTQGFGAIATAHALADAGKGADPADPYQVPRYFAVMDELWSALREGEGMVDRVDALGRLNRGGGAGTSDQYGLGTVMCSHTMEDAEALPEVDRAKARGLIERSGFIVAAALPPSEWPRLRSIGRWSDRELEENASWSTPPSWQANHDPDEPPPGRGKYMIKVAGRNALAFELQMMKSEKAVNNTNKRWAA